MSREANGFVLPAAVASVRWDRDDAALVAARLGYRRTRQTSGRQALLPTLRKLAEQTNVSVADPLLYYKYAAAYYEYNRFGNDGACDIDALRAPRAREILWRLGTLSHPGWREWSRLLFAYGGVAGRPPALRALGRRVYASDPNDVPTLRMYTNLLSEGKIEDVRAAVRIADRAAEQNPDSALHADTQGCCWWRFAMIAPSRARYLTA